MPVPRTEQKARGQTKCKVKKIIFDGHNSSLFYLSEVQSLGRSKAIRKTEIVPYETERPFSYI